MSKFSTEQEEFWAGKFGDKYISRNEGDVIQSSQYKYFADVLSRTNSVDSVIEFGANIGLNLEVIKKLRPDASLAAIEINEKAVKQLKSWAKDSVEIFHQSIYDFVPTKKYDLAYTKGVLIHLNPEKLPLVYDLLYKASSRYICVGEYYNTSPVTIEYRGNDDRLFKRDFAGELLERFSDLKLVDYGFAYHLDPNFPDDDITWFLLEKTGKNK